MENILEYVKTNAVVFSAAILIVAYIFIATEKINKVVVALFGACVCIILGLLSQDKALPDGTINPSYYANFIDFNVIFLLIAMMIIVSITARSGVFNYLALKLLIKTKGRPMAVLFCLSIFTAVTSAFLDNVTTVILVMPITLAVSKKLEISPIPLLITEVFASNIGGTATLIGDPPNIIIGSVGKLSFMEFVYNLTPIVCVVLITVTLVMAFIFRKSLKSSPQKMQEATNTSLKGVITDKALMFRSFSILTLVIIGFICHDAIDIQTSVIALTGACVLLVFEKPQELFKDVEWNTIFFFIGLFIVIGALEASGGIKIMADWILKITDGSQSTASMLILWASGIISGIIDNIPYTATMAPMILEIEKSLGAEYAYPLWWSLSLGACLGGNMTIIGAAANVIVSENAAHQGFKISFMQFFKYGIITTMISLILCTGYLYLKFFI